MQKEKLCYTIKKVKQKYDEIDRVNMNFSYMIFKPDNSIETYDASGNILSTIAGTSVTKTSHLFEGEIEGKTHIIAISMDGKNISAPDYMYQSFAHCAQIMIPDEKGLISFAIEVDGTLQTYQAEVGMTWEQWVGSKYDTLTTGELLKDNSWQYFKVCVNEENLYIMNNYGRMNEYEYILQDAIYEIGFPPV